MSIRRGPVRLALDGSVAGAIDAARAAAPRFRANLDRILGQQGDPLAAVETFGDDDGIAKTWEGDQG